MKWHVVSVNCDCASYWWGRKRHPNGNGYFMRCQYCKRQLGDFQYRYYGKIEASTESDAIKKAKEQPCKT